MSNTVTLSDHAIVRIVDLLQLALLTGTDIIDNLRTLRLTVDGSKLVIGDEENQAFMDAVKRLQDRAEELGAEGMRNVEAN
jgi:uncharacterized protein YbjQ (UPF0145 family)